MKILRYLALLILLSGATLVGTSFLNIASSQAAGSESGALQFVKSTAETGLKFLSSPESTQEQKRAEFKKLLNGSFDLDTIARFSLGRYWNQATDVQKKEYVALFKKMVINVYTGRFSDYKGQKFEVTTARSIGNNDTLVSSQIIPTDGGENIQVDWRVRDKGNGFKIVDVYVAGVSMGVTQRSDFSSVIQKGGGSVDVLINHLKSKV